MGAALCSCGGRGEELAGARGRLGLGAGSPAGVTALALDRHWHARNGKAVPLALAAKFSSLVPPGHSLPLPLAAHGGTPNGADPHGSLLASRGETYALSDDFLHEEDEQQRRAMLASRQTAAQALADAFRAKLQEPPMSPRSKFALLSTKLGEEDEDEEDEDQEEQVTNEDDKEEATDTDKTVATSDEEETPEGGARRRRRPRRSADEGGGLAAARRKPWGGHAYYASSFAAAYALSEGDDASLTEEDWKARANPLVTVIVPPGPCGLVLQVNQDARGAPPTVDGFVRTYDGLKGTIENSALVRKGSVLVAINDIDVSRMPLKEVIRTLNLSSHLERQFAFRNPPADTSAL